MPDRARPEAQPSRTFPHAARRAGTALRGWLLAAACCAAAPAALAAPGGATLSAQAPDAAQLRHGRALAQSCAACHGIDGNASGPQFPKLAGQDASYLERELEHFRPARAGAPAARLSPVMNPIAQGLSAQDRRDLAAYFASCRLKPALAPQASELAEGARIWRGGIVGRRVPACAACHGADGHGIPPLYPSLAGQWSEYLVSQLRAFRDGTRNDHGPMHDIASRMTESQIREVADFASGLH
ncbi:MAG: cytochrome c4 [Betaproteobacteria bacterium]|nr:cytochrome c4 [Betaproteobacteria bacterium]MDE1956642.1 cytochrome c4 [Betaproteobacteria bacterium]MDE2480426.1 cytochrome c4 [Betaproteobacteria bacterium]